MAYQLEHPEVLTIRDANGTPTHVVLSWDRDTARILGIKEPTRKDGRVHTAYALNRPVRERSPSRGELAGRN